MRARTIGWIAALLLPLFAAFAAPPVQPAPPAAVVLISVDQLGAELLARYDTLFTGGLRRLLDQGSVYTAVHDHAASETAPGHATLSTGTIPARSGIVGNAWYTRVDDAGWVEVYNTADSLSPVLGHPGEAGRSPRNLFRTGLADWVRAANPEARVVSIGGKDRSAILLAGRARGQVFWFDHDVGEFVTSRYYAEEYPAWVRRYNRDRLPEILDSVWVSQVPEAARALARPDVAPYEADGAESSAFPHRFAAEAELFGGEFSRWVGRTPFVDEAVLELAKTAIREERIGLDSVTDFLSLGLAQTDYVGHRYGPFSQEQLDNLLRLDRELGEFFRFLDDTVGEGRWVAGFSADHGVLPMPEWRAAQGRPGYRVSPAERERMREAAERAARGAPAGQVAERVSAALARFPFVADAPTFEQIARGEAADSFLALSRRSYFPGRPTGDFAPYGVAVRVAEGVYLGHGDMVTGTSHGSPYFYDRAVPLILLGERVPAGRGGELLRTVDLAPTLARLAGVPFPEDLDGRPIPLGREEN